MRRYWLIICLAGIVAILACKTVVQNKYSAITPSVPAHIVRTVSFASIAIVDLNIVTTNCVTNKLGQPKCYTNYPHVFTTLKSCGWDYSGITNDVVFLVYYTTNLSSTNNWKYIGQVSTQWFTVDATNQLDYYRIKASNVVSHFVSGL